MNKKLHKPDLTDKASARLTTKQLIGAAHHAARYLPKASGELVTELASRLDVTQVALGESLNIRNALVAEKAALVNVLDGARKGEPSLETMERAFREYCDIPNVREGLLQMWRIMRDDVFSSAQACKERKRLKK
ncbi:hypothetical protein [Atlantibacter hermannii]|uniref:hypothetical protein n=1 Tax=Atlantibacter hermannii TaxID=565 RepID=UPI0028AB7ED4|nr:hypothetical protein [Atlantibacter hermannii]